MAQFKRHKGIRYLTGWIVLVLLQLCLYAFSIAAHASPVIVVASDSQPLHQDIINGLKARLETLNAENIQIQVVNPENFVSVVDEAAADQLIVSIGTDNTVKVLSQHTKQPLLASAIPRLNFDELRARYASDLASGEQGRFFALLLDQPVTRRLDLIQQIIPGIKRIALVLGNQNRAYVGEIQQEVRKRRLQLQTGLVNDESELIDTLDRTLEHSDVMLGLLDPVVFNRANSRNILLTAYRWRVPLIGISPAYVRAGALASVYSSAEQIGWQLAESIVSYQAKGAKDLSDYQFPHYFKVAVNYQVAESMGLQIGDEASLKQALMEGQE